MKDVKDVILNERDNVGVALCGKEGIPAGHKFALKNIKAGEFVIKYGEIIGRATADIKAGDWVHCHNLKSHLNEAAEYSYNYTPAAVTYKQGFFNGFKRACGKAGIRNDIYIIPTVGCVNGICKRLEKAAQKYVRGSVDGVYALTHQFGCSQLGDDGENIKRLIAAIALNPNASFVLIVGLGCENNSLNGVKEALKPYKRNNIEYFNCQEVSNELDYGLEIIKRFIDKAAGYKRESVPLSELTVGLKCGGSDGYSGITANPLVGKFTDIIISYGGSAILTEVPETFGAEQLLMNRCRTKKVYEKYLKLITDFKNDYIKHGFTVYENPSPGNKEGGITTLEEKSLGCIKKAGSSDIVDVLEYGEQATVSGLNFLNAPGNDLIAATALAASGCQIVLFTTGRGTPFSTFVPTFKIATNNSLSQKKEGWIDFNAFSFNERSLFNAVLNTVNGEYRCKSEDIREIAFYKTGVTL